MLLGTTTQASTADLIKETLHSPAPAFRIMFDADKIGFFSRVCFRAAAGEGCSRTGCTPNPGPGKAETVLTPLLCRCAGTPSCSASHGWLSTSWTCTAACSICWPSSLGRRYNCPGMDCQRVGSIIFWTTCCTLAEMPECLSLCSDLLAVSCPHPKSREVIGSRVHSYD